MSDHFQEAANKKKVIVQQRLVRVLAQLGDTFNDMEQTTHGSIPLDISVESVCEQIIETFHRPSSYNISELRQRCKNLHKALVGNTHAKGPL